MSRIEWDKVGEHYLEMGTDHGVLYVQNATGGYEAGVPWNGLTAVTDTPGGAEPTDFYADNIKYASIRSAETWGATIEAYTYPDEFAECDGSRSPIKGVYVRQQNRKPFGFTYRTLIQNDTATEDDDAYKLHLCYNNTASPSEKPYTTVNDSPDAVTFSWEITSTPVNVGVEGIKPTSVLEIDSRDFAGEGTAKLKALEDKLYGTEEAEPTLPSPLEVLNLLGYTKTMAVSTKSSTSKPVAVATDNK